MTGSMKSDLKSAVRSGRAFWTILLQLSILLKKCSYACSLTWSPTLEWVFKSELFLDGQYNDAVYHATLMESQAFTRFPFFVTILIIFKRLKSYAEDRVRVIVSWLQSVRYWGWHMTVKKARIFISHFHFFRALKIYSLAFGSCGDKMFITREYPDRCNFYLLTQIYFECG